jgi:hypothetical protein
MTRWLVLAAIVPAASAQAQHLYALDDGSGIFNLGPSEFDASMTWGNYFHVQSGADVLTGILVSFSGSLGAGHPVMLAVFDDPDDDGDPRNAVAVALTEALSAQTGSTDFARYGIEPVRVSGGFFVAAIMDVKVFQSAARMDESTPGENSWLFFNEDLNLDLGSSPVIFRMADHPFNGTWMVRAEAVPAPAAAGSCLGGVFMVGRRRRGDSSRHNGAPGRTRSGCRAG